MTIMCKIKVSICSVILCVARLITTEEPRNVAYRLPMLLCFPSQDGAGWKSEALGKVCLDVEVVVAHRREAVSSLPTHDCPRPVPTEVGVANRSLHVRYPAQDSPNKNFGTFPAKVGSRQLCTCLSRHVHDKIMHASIS